MKNKESTITNMIIAMASVCFFSALTIGYVYDLTAPKIKKAKEDKIISTISKVVTKFNNNPYAEKIQITSHDATSSLTLYPAKKDGVVTSVAISSTAMGYNGNIEVIVGFLLDGTITRYEVIEQKETPGIGDVIQKDIFANQFIGLISYINNFKLSKNGGDIDAISGATVSSNAVANAVEKAANAYNKFSKGIMSYEDK